MAFNCTQKGVHELLWSRMTRFPALFLFYFSLPPPPQETLVNTLMIRQGQKNTSAVGAHQGSAEPSLLAAGACGKVRLAAMVKVPRRENKSHGEGWVCQAGCARLGVLAHACNPRSQVVEGNRRIAGQHGLRRKNIKAERDTTPKNENS